MAQTSWAYDSALPRDRIVNTPCFRWDNLTIQDAESLAINVLDAYEARFATLVGKDAQCKIYDLEGTPPVLPMATVTRNAGILHTSTYPREIALCLSFNGGQRQPRQRGRLYIPPQFIGASLALRPTVAQTDAIVQFANNLHGVGGANVDWIVWSRVNRSATGVNEAWVDDEWDIQRRRGLRGTTRSQINF